MRKFLKNTYQKIMELNSEIENYRKPAGCINIPCRAYTNKALQLAGMNDYENAAKILETAVMMNTGDPEPCVLLGSIYIKMKEYNKASKVLLNAVRRDSQNAGAYLGLGSVYTASD